VNMATKTAKKGSSKKGSSKKKGKEPDPLEDLEREIADDLEKEFDFEDGDAAEDGEESLIDKVVSFETTNEDGDEVTITGKIVEVDGNDLVVEDDEALWEAELDDVEFVDPPKTKKAPAPAKGKAKGKGKTPPKKDESKETKVQKTDEPEMRLIEVDKITIPKLKARDVDPKSEKYQRMSADIKRRGQRVPIEVDNFDKPTVTDGLHRIAIAKEQKRKLIPCVIGGVGETQDDRLWNSLLSNEMRIEPHWIDLAKNFARLSKGEYSQRKISRAFGMSESDVSRMVNALQLPKAFLEIARNGVTKGKDTVTYSSSVFYELVKADDEVRKEILTFMKAGDPVGLRDVRGMKKKAAKEAKKEAESKGEEHKSETRGGKRESKKTASTYRKLPSSQTGDYLSVVVHEDHVEVRAHVDWTKKTFRNLDLTEEIKELFETVFADEDIEAIDSMEALAKAMTAVKAELG